MMPDMMMRSNIGRRIIDSKNIWSGQLGAMKITRGELEELYLNYLLSEKLNVTHYIISMTQKPYDFIEYKINGIGMNLFLKCL